MEKQAKYLSVGDGVRNTWSDFLPETTTVQAVQQGEGDMLIVYFAEDNGAFRTFHKDLPVDVVNAEPSEHTYIHLHRRDVLEYDPANIEEQLFEKLLRVTNTPETRFTPQEPQTKGSVILEVTPYGDSNQQIWIVSFFDSHMTDNRRKSYVKDSGRLISDINYVDFHDNPEPPISIRPVGAFYYWGRLLIDSGVMDFVPQTQEITINSYFQQ